MVERELQYLELASFSAWAAVAVKVRRAALARELVNVTEAATSAQDSIAELRRVLDARALQIIGAKALHVLYAALFAWRIQVRDARREAAHRHQLLVHQVCLEDSVPPHKHVTCFCGGGDFCSRTCALRVTWVTCGGVGRVVCTASCPFCFDTLRTLSLFIHVVLQCYVTQRTLFAGFSNAFWLSASRECMAYSCLSARMRPGVLGAAGAPLGGHSFPGGFEGRWAAPGSLTNGGGRASAAPSVMSHTIRRGAGCFARYPEHRPIDLIVSSRGDVNLGSLKRMWERQHGSPKPPSRQL